MEYNCHYFILTFRMQIHKKKFRKKCFRNLQGTMYHRPLTNTSSLKIAAAYWAVGNAGLIRDHCIGLNPDARLRQLSTKSNANAGLTFLRHTGIYK
jgi:hypothetical protein